MKASRNEKLSVISDYIYNMYSNTDVNKFVYKVCKNYTMKKMGLIPSKEYVKESFKKSIDIKTGTALEGLLKELITQSNRYTVLDLCNKKYINMKVPQIVIYYIDSILNQLDSKEIKIVTESEYLIILENIINLTVKYLEDKDNLFKFDCDVDLLFQDNMSKHIYFAEIKKLNNHDTVKDRGTKLKFFRTFAFLVYHYKIKDISEISPMLLFFEEEKVKYNGIYSCDKGVITGREFVSKYTSLTYQDIVDGFEISNMQDKSDKIEEIKNKIDKSIQIGVSVFEQLQPNDLKKFKSGVESYTYNSVKLKADSPRFKL